ncbi:1-acyl-sn-glycerol-3-phosphate acyltransferase [Aquisalinus flavus]|nr:1-acyl-sn-glycerol-3-phosphate acyltransferase [Aquisalinus flavus]UNE49296.1 1-acyl-sn-glycerol-3-phosphate acyltransferase [Aquisalinus flavus]
MPLSALVTGLVCLPSVLRRDWALAVCKVWGRLALGMLKVVCGTDYRIEGRGNMPDGPALLAVKHQSMWETIALAVLLPNPCFVLKKELIAIPVFGWWCRAAGFIAVDRAAGANAMRQMLDAARERLDEGCQILIFPEGTRIAPGETGTYHPGVAGLYKALGTPCVPVAHNSGLFFRYPGIRREPGTITLTFLPPIEPGMKRSQFLAEVKSAIETEALRLVAPAPSGKAAERGADKSEYLR